MDFWACSGQEQNTEPQIPQQHSLRAGAHLLSFTDKEREFATARKARTGLAVLGAAACPCRRWHDYGTQKR